VRRLTLACLALCLALGLIPASGNVARAVETRLPSSPALLSADRVSYDEDLGLIVASGHVEISQGERVLRADTVTYNQRADTITASGNVALLEPSGDVLFGNFFELTQGLKDGVAQNFRLLMKDHSRFAAAGARREGGVVTEMAKGVFSPCNLCKDDPQRAPLWQIKADRIVHNEQEHEIYYKDALLEMYGVPVVYTPYFSHPDPTVKRRSGFLAPSYGQDTQIGTLIKIPYFWAISPDKDLTIAPIFTTGAGQVLNGEYRQRWGNGEIDAQGSITDQPAVDSSGNGEPGRQLRGNLKAKGIFAIDDNWRTGFDVQRQSDDTYLRFYKTIYAPPTVLPSNGYVEGFFGRSYNALNAYAFQDTRSTVKIKDLPIVAPIYEFNYVSDAGSHGQRWRVDASAMNLFRPSGVDTRRLSQRTQWELPYTSPIGDIYSLTLSLQTDGYSTLNNINPDNPNGLSTAETAGRAMPQGKFEWRYPWVRQDGTVQEVIEPRAALIVGPNGRNAFIIPNEDSQDFEFDDQNLFSLNRFPGVDRVDGGNRVVYGTSFGAYGNKGGGTSLFIGQSYRFHKDQTFDSTSGLQDNLSDFVGHLKIQPLTFLSVDYRFRMAAKDFSPHRTEVNASAGFSRFSVNTSYVSLTQEVPGQGLVAVNQLQLSGTRRLSNFWSVSGSGVRDLTDGQFRSLAVVASYQDECFTLNASVSRNFSRDRDIQPSTTILAQLIFKHLGEVNIGTTTGSNSGS
jgi:LPS-assembly protein